MDRVNVFGLTTTSAQRQGNGASNSMRHFNAWKRASDEVVTAAQSDYAADMQRAEQLSLRIKHSSCCSRGPCLLIK